jgi:hypothetical protein
MSPICRVRSDGEESWLLFESTLAAGNKGERLAAVAGRRVVRLHGCMGVRRPVNGGGGSGSSAFFSLPLYIGGV